MSKKISPEIISQIPILYASLKSYTKVAEELGISIASVKKYLKLGEAALAAKPRVKITPEIIEQINLLYAKNRNMAEVARQLGISGSTVKKYLSEENLQTVQDEYDARDALYFYIYRLFGEYSKEYPVDPWNVLQMQKFVKQGMPYKGQLLALKYFYEIKGNQVKEKYKTIGIISYIYSEAMLFYEREAAKAEEIALSIKRQLEKDRLEIKIDPAAYITYNGKKRKKKIDLKNLEVEDN